MKVNTEIIRNLNPCNDRFENWLEHYKDFDGNIIDFLSLEKITARDKIWVTLRLLRDEGDLFTLQVFAIDCAFAAAYAAYYAADAAADAADAAADAADAAADAAAYAAYAAYAAADAADAAADAAAYAAYAAYAAADAAAYAEREQQVDALIYLLKNRDTKAKA